MIRLYRFDLARNTIDVETISPWVLGRAGEDLNELERRETELTGPQDCFSVPVDFEKRFAGFAPVPPRGPRPAAQMLVPGTVAYWRFDNSHPEGSPSDPALRIPDLSGHGNDLTREPVPGSPADALRWSAGHHPDQPGHGSLYFDGGKPPLHGAYLRTAKDAPLNSKTFRSGYTIEAFFRLPADWDAGHHAWGSILSRRGTLGAARKTAGDPEEPVATLSLSDGPGLQWAAAPLNQPGLVTNWSHELERERWWHVAVVNDAKHTTMYVDGCQVARNPFTATTGLGTVGVIRGAVCGPAADRDEWRAPDTKVVHTADVGGRTGRYTLRIPLGKAEESFYVRLRGSDGKLNGPGFLGAAIDPHGPIPHEPGNGDAWADTWCYTNPVFVDVVR